MAKEDIDLEKVRIPKREIIQVLEHLLEDFPEKIPVTELEAAFLSVVRRNLLKQQYPRDPQTMQKFQDWISSYKAKRGQ